MPVILEPEVELLTIDNWELELLELLDPMVEFM